jgi:hypothetical protein
MRYALLIYTARDAVLEPADGPGVDIPAPSDGVVESWLAYTRSVKDAGVLVALERLHPDETATSVRVRSGERLITDGPFIETKEQLLGFYLIEAPDLDSAIDWAARMPSVRQGTVEVRPIYPQPHLAQIVAE